MVETEHLVRRSDMADRDFHPLYLHFQELPLSLRAVYTGTLLVLGLGYLFASMYIFDSHAGRDGEPMLGPDDLIAAYAGSSDGTRLEAAIRGPMAGMLSPEERDVIVAWIASGADQASFGRDVRTILQQRCIKCHNASQDRLPNLDGYEHVMETVQVDKGMSISTLIRVSHIHLLGITFLFFIVGIIFSHAYMRPVWLKVAITASPFACIGLDVVSWYAVKLFPNFAYMILLTGTIMGTCFATMWFVSLRQMWFYELPAELAERHRSFLQNPS